MRTGPFASGVWWCNWTLLWPSLYLITHNNRIVGMRKGEGQSKEQRAKTISRLLTTLVDLFQSLPTSLSTATSKQKPMETKDRLTAPSICQFICKLNTININSVHEATPTDSLFREVFKPFVLSTLVKTHLFLVFITQ